MNHFPVLLELPNEYVAKEGGGDEVLELLRDNEICDVILIS